MVQYDDFGATFGKSRRDLHWPEIDSVLEKFLENFTPTTHHMADIGCGNGRLLAHIRDHKNADIYKRDFTTYVGLDMSSVLLGQAQEEDFTDIFPVIEWRESNMNCISEELGMYGNFDALFFIASFHHLATYEERVSVLRQAQSLLSETGKIAMINWNLSHPSQSKYQDSKIREYPNGSADYDIKIGAHTRFYHAFSEAEYTSLGLEVGLSVDSVFGERNSIVFFQ